MRAYRMLEWERAPSIVEVAVPEPGPGQVLVKVAANGLCHSDLTMMAMPAAVGSMLGWQMPFTLGHEVAGWVEEVGDGVKGVRRGRAVALVSPSSCGACGPCRQGRDSLCATGLAGRGYGRDGGLAEYVLAGGPRDLVPLGDLDPVLAAPLTDAGATTYHGVRRVLPRLVDGTTAIVLGAGGLGGYAVQLLRALSPARVIAVDPDPIRRAVALDLGAHEVLDGVDRSTAGTLGELTGPDKAQVVLDYVGIDTTIYAGLAVLAPGGAYALVGAAGGTLKKPWYGHLPREAEIFTYQGSTIADAHAVIGLAAEGRIRSPVERFALDRVAHAYAALEAGGLSGRVVVEPGA
jgi:propanol-preferring alcohol dehydrogenase